MEMPDNHGERRECLNILEKVDWKKGLLHDLVTDAEVSQEVQTLVATILTIPYSVCLT